MVGSIGLLDRENDAMMGLNMPKPRVFDDAVKNCIVWGISAEIAA
jgi:hypothetical protein